MIVDGCFKTRVEAVRETERRRNDPAPSGVVAKIVPSAHCGFRARSIDADMPAGSLTGDLPEAFGRWAIEPGAYGK